MERFLNSRGVILTSLSSFTKHADIQTRLIRNSGAKNYFGVIHIHEDERVFILNRHVTIDHDN